MTQPLRTLNTWDTTTLQRQYFPFFQMNLFDNIAFSPALLSCGPAQGDAQSWPVCARRERIVFSLSSWSILDFLSSSNLDLCCVIQFWRFVVVIQLGISFFVRLKFNLFLKGDSHGWKGLIELRSNQECKQTNEQSCKD